MRNKIGIVIPVYNGSQYITELLDGLTNSQRKQLIIVDDGSTDSTGEELRNYELCSVRHARNRGKGAALLSGAEKAAELGADFIITMDADLQHPLSAINQFTKHAKDHSIGLGYRWNRATMPIMRRLSNFITSLLVSIRTNTVIKDSQCGFRIMPVALMRQYTFRECGFAFETEVLLKAGLMGYSVRHIPIPTIYSKQPSAIAPITDTIRFMILWFRSYFWV